MQVMKWIEKQFLYWFGGGGTPFRANLTPRSASMRGEGCVPWSGEWANTDKSLDECECDPNMALKKRKATHPFWNSLDMLNPLSVVHHALRRPQCDMCASVCALDKYICLHTLEQRWADICIHTMHESIWDSWLTWRQNRFLPKWGTFCNPPTNAIKECS